ncbi:GspE/PulE/PilB domain-containing protein [Paraliomyxa miuraensis]|uniref:GspE/PulE/PilB domain-containing protein n=1 Tax=Paraliomyxa miuraensis TaxID=376150 RepID=UPI00225723EB|nr:hypothetical protein [Paraliomyxa miuraensis]MCX4245667.1 hypothetical protein [Paraliomyxa miuraensis]
MSNLVIMLQRAGLLPDDAATQIREFAYANKVPLAEVLVDRGFATEDDLVKFLQSKLMIPEVEADLLGELERETLRHLPAELAWYHEVLPVSVDDVGNLTLAMADPTDLRAVDAVIGHTGAYLVRAVAPLTALRRALERYYGPRPDPEELRTRLFGEPEPEADESETDESEADESETDESETDESETDESETDESETDESEADESLPPTAFAEPTPPGTPPVRRPVVTPVALEEPVIPLSPTAFARVLPRLVAAANRDEITHVLLDFLAEGFSRVIMFVHLQQQLRGRDARGDDLLLEAITQVRIPTTGPSLFRDVIERGGPHFGPWRSDTKINAAFGQAMGGIRGNVLLLPVKLRERVPVVVYAAGTHHPVDPRSLHELVEGVSGALERLIFRRKSLTDAPQQD